MSGASKMLSLTKVNSYYDQLQILRDISLKIDDGSIIGLLGPNGAGKSTLLKTIIGMVNFKGIIEFNGKRINKLSTKSIVEQGIVYVPEGRRVFPEMTVDENLDLGAMSSLAKSEKDNNKKDVYEIFPILRERRDQLAITLSGGELQFLAIGRGLMGSPKVLLIDEPSLGLSPRAISAVFQRLQDINKRSKTVFIVEQNVPRLLDLVSYAYVLENGTIASSGTPAELQENEDFVKSYLGME